MQFTKKLHLLKNRCFGFFSSHPRSSIVGGVLALVVFLPLATHVALNPFEFNQFIITKDSLVYGGTSLEMLSDNLRSAYTSGWNILLGRAKFQAPAFDDPHAFFDYVFSWIPPYAVVYPTEGFYYYRGTISGIGPLYGNVRVAGLADKKMSLAYFTVPDKNTVIHEFTPADGLQIKEYSPYSYDLTYKGKTVHFKIPQTDITFPKKMALLPEEDFVAQIHDESGIRFFLLRNRATNSFYEVLNEEEGVTDRFKKLKDSYLIGTHSGFVYFSDKSSGRKILIGVDSKNGEANNFFDGPGDQVPIRITLSPLLHRVYPSTLTHEGVDLHGVWRGKDEWARFVVAPFHHYRSYDELLARAEPCRKLTSKTELYTCLGKEGWNNASWRKQIADRLRDEGKILERDGKLFIVEDLIPYEEAFPDWDKSR